MPAPVLDERPHVAAVTAAIAAVNAQLGEDTYDDGDVPGMDDDGEDLVPRIFVVLKIERRYLESTKSTRHSSRSSWRISARYVGTTKNEARWAGARVSDAFESVRLSVEGFTSSPIEHETTSAVAKVDGRFSGLSTWTYTL